MKYLKTAEQYENQLLLENANTNVLEMPKLTGYKSIQTKILKDLKLDFYFVSTFGTTIAIFYPVIEKLLNNSEFSMPLSKSNIALMTLYALAFLFKENKNQLETLKSVINEKGLGDMTKMIIESIKSIKTVFVEIAKKFGKMIRNMSELFSYTALLVPFMNCLIEYANNTNLSIKSLVAMGTGLLIASLTKALIYISDQLYDKLKLKLKNNKTFVYDPETEEGAISLIERNFERVRKQLEKSKNYDLIDITKNSIYYEDIVISKYKSFPDQEDYYYSIVLRGESFDGLNMPKINDIVKQFFDYLSKIAKSTDSVWQSYRHRHRIISN